MLATRLSGLVDEGLLEPRPYQSNPERFEYHATAKAGELWPVLMPLLLWGNRHYPALQGPPQIAEHKDCGGHITSELTCDRCGKRLRPGEVLLRPRRGGRATPAE